jgi:hypothetical protein
MQKFDKSGPAVYFASAITPSASPRNDIGRLTKTALDLCIRLLIEPVSLPRVQLGRNPVFILDLGEVCSRTDGVAPGGFPVHRCGVSVRI